MGRVGGWLSRLFGSGSGSANGTDDAISVSVRCNACGEIVKARINPASELSQSDDDGGYFVRKVLVGKQCYRPIEVNVRYADLGRTEVSREVHGGTSVE